MKLLIIIAVAGCFVSASGAQDQTAAQYGIMRGHGKLRAALWTHYKS